MIQIFQRLWQVNWAEQWQYRANLLMYLLYWLVSPIIYLAVWTSIANTKGDVNGFTANDFITYYMTLLIVDQITSNIVIHTFAYKIQDGTLSGELIRPIHPMLTNALVNNISFKALTIMGLIPVWIILFFLFKPDFSNVTLIGILLAIPAMTMGFFIGFLLSAAITSLAFWTTRVYSIHEFYYAAYPDAENHTEYCPVSAVPAPLILSHSVDPGETIQRTDRSRLCDGWSLACGLCCIFQLGMA